MKVETVRNKDGKAINYIVVNNECKEVTPISEFINYLRVKNYSPNTLKNYTYDLRYCFEYFYEVLNKDYLDIRSKDLVGLVEYLSDHLCKNKPSNMITFKDICAGASKTGKLSPNTVNRILATISSFYDWANLTNEDHNNSPVTEVVDYKTVPVNESFKGFLSYTRKQNQMKSRFLKIKAPKPLPRPLSDEHVKMIVDDVNSYRDKAILLIAFQGGLRIGEILGITFEDINFRKREITIKFREDNPNGSRVKNSKDRIVQIYEQNALDALNNYILYERPESESEYIFLTNKGKTKGNPLTYQGINTIFNYHCNKLGLKVPNNSLTLHSLRHTHATKMYENGMDVLSLQKRLGHSSPQSTQVYTKVSNEKVKEEYSHAIGNYKTDK